VRDPVPILVRKFSKAIYKCGVSFTICILYHLWGGGGGGGGLGTRLAFCFRGPSRWYWGLVQRYARLALRWACESLFSDKIFKLLDFFCTQKEPRLVSYAPDPFPFCNSHVKLYNGPCDKLQCTADNIESYTAFSRVVRHIFLLIMPPPPPKITLLFNNPGARTPKTTRCETSRAWPQI